MCLSDGSKLNLAVTIALLRAEVDHALTWECASFVIRAEKLFEGF